MLTCDTSGTCVFSGGHGTQPTVMYGSTCQALGSSRLWPAALAQLPEASVRALGHGALTVPRLQWGYARTSGGGHDLQQGTGWVGTRPEWENSSSGSEEFPQASPAALTLNPHSWAPPFPKSFQSSSHRVGWRQPCEGPGESRALGRVWSRGPGSLEDPLGPAVLRDSC